ncbi:Glucokinase, partial [Globisporangium splendens]
MIEGGHMIVERNGRLCGCSQRGCLEAYSSAGALVLEAQEHVAAGADSVLATYPSESISAELIFRLAKEGDAMCTRLIVEVNLALSIVPYFRGLFTVIHNKQRNVLAVAQQRSVRKFLKKHHTAVALAELNFRAPALSWVEIVDSDQFKNCDAAYSSRQARQIDTQLKRHRQTHGTAAGASKLIGRLPNVRTGVDIGEASVKVALVDAQGRTNGKIFQKPLGKRDAEYVVDPAFTLLHEALSDVRWTVTFFLRLPPPAC